jgi:hypothetical protein
VEVLDEAGRGGEQGQAPDIAPKLCLKLAVRSTSSQHFLGA